MTQPEMEREGEWREIQDGGGTSDQIRVPQGGHQGDPREGKKPATKASSCPDGLPPEGQKGVEGFEGHQGPRGDPCEDTDSNHFLT